MRSTGLALREPTTTLASCPSCGDLVPDRLGGVPFDGEFRCRPCLFTVVREDLILLALELDG